MSRTNKNSYLKLLLITGISALFSGVIGASGYILFSNSGEKIGITLSSIMVQIQNYMLPALILLTIVSVIIGEYSCRKLKFIGEQILKTEDEECDSWEYKEEKIGAFGLNMNILSQVLGIMLLVTGYSSSYIEEYVGRFLCACVIFMLCEGYDSIWQIRYVKITQHNHPEKQGDPTSKKFQQQWLDSCDEAEKERIYKSSYKTYLIINRSMPVLIFGTMILHLFFDTGILATVVVAIMWLIATFSYNHSCVTLRGNYIKK